PARDGECRGDRGAVSSVCRAEAVEEESTRDGYAVHIVASSHRSALRDGSKEFGNVDDGGTQDDGEQRRQNQEGHREEDLDGQLAGSLLGALAALPTQQVGVRAKRLRHAGAEPVAG